MTDQLELSLLTVSDLESVAILGQQLNPTLALAQIKAYLLEMFGFPTYTCFGFFLNGKLVGVSSAWTTIRLYSGKQLEVDNVIIDSSLQSQGLGKRFFELLEDWARKNNYKTIELNTYVQNAKSHKFYFNLGYSILGFHFWKHI